MANRIVIECVYWWCECTLKALTKTNDSSIIINECSRIIVLVYKNSRKNFFAHFEDSAFYRPSRKGAIPGYVLLSQARAEEAGSILGILIMDSLSTGKGPLLELLLVMTTAVEPIHRYMDTLWRPSIGTLSTRSQGCTVCYFFFLFFLGLLLPRCSIVLGAEGSRCPGCCQEQDPWAVMLA